MKTKTKHRQGGQKVVREVIAGDNFFRESGKWDIVHRIIDRANNWYEETIGDRIAGAILHRNAERLSDHRHGAKKEGTDKPEG